MNEFDLNQGIWAVIVFFSVLTISSAITHIVDAICSAWIRTYECWEQRDERFEHEEKMKKK